MRVAVGSGNPVKLRATERALPDPGATVESVAVESGVPDQPRGQAETVEGAENRAGRAVAAGDYDLGVGVEGGVARTDAADGLYLVMWAAVTDGEVTARAAGPSVRLPDAVADAVDAGRELGPVMDEFTGTHGVKHGRGAAGVLTGGAMDREAALGQAVAGALGPFVTDHYADDGPPPGLAGHAGGPAGGGDVRLHPAGPDDLGRVRGLLDAAGLPTADVGDGSATFVLARAGGEVVGTGGLEVRGDAALLRSVAVEESARRAGHGTAIARRLAAVARALGVRGLYLLTTDAAGFFEALGYERVDRAAVPDPIRETEQFAGLCPDSATPMRLRLD